MAVEKGELRGDAPLDLISALEAIAQAHGMTRTALVNKLLTREVNKIAHRSFVLQRMARGNALLSEPTAPTSEFGEL
jgi:hypothetical protein